MNLSAKKKMSLMRVEKKILRWKLTLKKDLELKSSGTYFSREREREADFVDPLLTQCVDMSTKTI